MPKIDMSNRKFRKKKKTSETQKFDVQAMEYYSEFKMSRIVRIAGILRDFVVAGWKKSCMT